ncbi:hypothetical protein BDV06DRAFT_30061 [Aspergillus oleicola]
MGSASRPKPSLLPISASPRQVFVAAARKTENKCCLSPPLLILLLFLRLRISAIYLRHDPGLALGPIETIVYRRITSTSSYSGNPFFYKNSSTR